MKLFKEKVNEKQRALAGVMFAVMIVANGVAAATTWLGGMTTAQVSDSFPNLFAPAGYTFSIWSLIYILLAAYTIYQINVFKSRKMLIKQETLEKITPYFFASSALNTLWIFAWQYKVMWLSVLLIIGLLATLVMINRELYDKQFSLLERLVVKAPFSVYFGWITVATIANITTWLVSTGWNGGGLEPQYWMVIISIIGALIGIKNMFKYSDCAYGFVVVWAFVGIFVKHLSVSGWNSQHPMVIGALIALISVLSAASLYIFIRVASRLAKGERRALLFQK